MLESIDSPSEAELVVAMQNGSEEAFASLYQEYKGEIFGLALRRCRNRSQAEEIVQLVFTQVYQKKDQLRDPELFPNWLRRITIRLTINYIVRGPREELYEYTDGLVDADTATSGVVAISRERVAQVRDVLACHPHELDRITLSAYYFEGMSLLEMADRFSAPVGTIKRRLHTARSRFGERLRAIGINESDL